MPVQLSVGENGGGLSDAMARSKELMEFATLQKADWHLYLEDDQELTEEFWKNLSVLLNYDDIDLFYLADREIQIGQLGHINQFRVNRIRSNVAGSHGLLYQTKHIPALLKARRIMPVDFWFFKVIDPHKFRLFQILSPILARHIGDKSTLRYKNQEPLTSHPKGI